MEELSLASLPAPPKVPSSRKEARIGATPSKPRGRPSWGPKPSPSKGKMRLLEGLDEVQESTKRNGDALPKKDRTLGAMSYGAKGAQKARQSIFAKPAQHVTATSRSRPSVDAEDGEESFYKDRALSSSTSSVKERVAAMERAGKAASDKSSPLKGAPKLPESGEQLDVQLAEVKRLNSVFDAYEQMLIGSSDQIEVSRFLDSEILAYGSSYSLVLQDFSTRISETNSLLDSYIDLMRQMDRTQQLLLDTEWKGVTEDEATHALAMELAEREQRRRQEEEEEAARLAAHRAQGLETARIAAEVAQQKNVRSTATSSARGARGAVRGSGIPTRGTAGARGRGAATGAAATRGRVASSTTTRTPTVGSSSTAGRTSSLSSGTSSRYANVRSSGYGPR